MPARLLFRLPELARQRQEDRQVQHALGEKLSRSSYVSRNHSNYVYNQSMPSQPACQLECRFLQCDVAGNIKKKTKIEEHRQNGEHRLIPRNHYRAIFSDTEFSFVRSNIADSQGPECRFELRLTWIPFQHHNRVSCHRYVSQRGS